MKILVAILLLLLLTGIVAVEYFHHGMDHQAHDDTTHTTPQEKAEKARELYQQHMRSHS